MIKSILSEYKTLCIKIEKLKFKLATSPVGYISEKKINGKNYFYLQYRSNGQVKSQYIKNIDVATMSKKLQLAQEYKSEIDLLQNRLLEIERAAKLLDKSIYRNLILYKISFNINNLSKVEKEKSIDFANAMNAIEGVFVSKETQATINLWKDGALNFESVFQATLNMYGFQRS